MKYKYYYSVNHKPYKKMTKAAANKSVFHCRVFSLCYMDKDGDLQEFAYNYSSEKFHYAGVIYTRERRPYTFGRLCKYFDKGVKRIPRIREYTSK